LSTPKPSHVDVETDEIEAFEYLTKAHEAGIVAATSDLANMYKKRKDYEHAFPLAKKAADADFSDAMVNVGVMYEDGSGTEKDPLQAASYYKRSYELGNVVGGRMYALALIDGLAGTPNPGKAIEILEADVSKDVESNSDVKGTLAWELYRAYNLAYNNDKADYWLNKAADLGQVKAKSLLKERDLTSKLKLNVEGFSIGFFTKAGRLSEIETKESTSISTVNGNTRSHTTRWQVLHFTQSDGEVFTVTPDKDIDMVKGKECNVIYCGKGGTGEGYPWIIVPENSDKAYLGMKLDEILKKEFPGIFNSGAGKFALIAVAIFIFAIILSANKAESAAWFLIMGSLVLLVKSIMVYSSGLSRSSRIRKAAEKQRDEIIRLIRS
jgi:hypothetical protein